MSQLDISYEQVKSILDKMLLKCQSSVEDTATMYRFLDYLEAVSKESKKNALVAKAAFERATDAAKVVGEVGDNAKKLYEAYSGVRMMLSYALEEVPHICVNCINYNCSDKDCNLNEDKRLLCKLNRNMLWRWHHSNLDTETRL